MDFEPLVVFGFPWILYYWYFYLPLYSYDLLLSMLDYKSLHNLEGAQPFKVGKWMTCLKF